MTEINYEKWSKLHTFKEIRNNLPPQILKSWEESHTAGINPNRSVPLICSDEEFSICKENCKSLFIYSNEILSKTPSKFDDFEFGIALFDRNGCLLKFYGDDSFKLWAKENKIEKKSVWDEKTIGTNAVSLGLKYKKPFEVNGEEHYSRFAIDMSVYFSPILVEKDAREKFVLGGIAIITPSINKNSVLSVLSESIASKIALQCFWFQSCDIFFDSIEGYLALDQSNKDNRILYINKQVFNIFNIPFKNMYYRNVEEIIDPLPENKEFWNIVSNKTKVQDMDMKVSVHGKQIKLNISVRPFYARDFHIDGVSIIISSRERIQKLVSKHTGNNANFNFSQIIGSNTSFMNVLSQGKAASQNNINVLLLGESGVGKDIIAQSIHNASDRSQNPFIAVNCASFPKDLISSELFGYEEGAFTGSKKGGNIGKFELANHGTIFLDEIGDMPLDLQAVLLRVIEQKSLMKIGGVISTDLDVRIIAATNKNLKKKILRGEFREDLYYRLGIIKLMIPPLRQRKDDILILAEQFIEQICFRVNKPIVNLSDEVKDFFVKYDWPGNVREMKNLLECVIQIYDAPTINLEQIQNYVMDEPVSERNMLMQSLDERSMDNTFSFNANPSNANESSIKLIKKHSKECVLSALESNKYNKNNTAEYLGISRKTLYNRMREYGIE